MSGPPHPSRLALAAAFVSALLALALTACSSGAGDTDQGRGTSRPPSTTASATTARAPDPQEAADPSDGCVAPGAAAGTPPATGTTDHTDSVAGHHRHWHRFVPQGYDPSAPAPLVLNFHGLTSPIEAQEMVSDFDAKADQVGAVVLTPGGAAPGPAWNVSDSPSYPDDLAFVKGLLDRTERELCIDTNRVYATGLSNGAQMTSYLACRLADRIAAFAPVAGLNPGPPDCRPARPVPVIAFHGTEDRYLPLEGGQGSEADRVLGDIRADPRGPLAGLALPAIPDAQDIWARRDRCTGGPVETQVAEHVTERRFTGCAAGAEVVLYEVGGAGHTWPGSAGSAAIASVVGPTSFEIVANDLIWDFFTAHPLPTG